MNALYKDAAWQKSMQLKLDFNGMMKQFVGEHGLDPDELTRIKKCTVLPPPAWPQSGRR